METLHFDFAPWRLSGQVVGVLLNDRAALAALGDAVNQPPHKAPPHAPVLYFKPRNTQVGDGAVVAVPADAPALEVGAALGLVIGRSATAVPEERALAHVAGLVVVADLCVPHDSYYRPSVRLRARDGFCPLGPSVVPVAGLEGRIDALHVQVRVDGAPVHDTTTGGRIRPAARLIADVSEFMTLSPGDVLLLGVSHGAPRVGAGHAVAVEIEGAGTLRFQLEGEA